MHAWHWFTFAVSWRERSEGARYGKVRGWSERERERESE
jgi:hypothetical protein